MCIHYIYILTATIVAKITMITIYLFTHSYKKIIIVLLGKAVSYIEIVVIIVLFTEYKFQIFR